MSGSEMQCPGGCGAVTGGGWCGDCEPADTTPSYLCPHCGALVGILGNWLASIFGRGIHDCELIQQKRVNQALLAIIRSRSDAWARENEDLYRLATEEEACFE